MGITIYIIAIIIATLITFRYYIYKSKSHEVHKLLDKYGAILAFDDKRLIAVLYRDRTIDWMHSTSLFKMIKVKEISDHFEEEYELLKNEQ